MRAVATAPASAPPAAAKEREREVLAAARRAALLAPNEADEEEDAEAGDVEVEASAPIALRRAGPFFRDHDASKAESRWAVPLSAARRAAPHPLPAREEVKVEDEEVDDTPIAAARQAKPSLVTRRAFTPLSDVISTADAAAPPSMHKKLSCGVARRERAAASVSRRRCGSMTDEKRK